MSKDNYEYRTRNTTNFTKNTDSSADDNRSKHRAIANQIAGRAPAKKERKEE